jgi:hypothetical protein
VVIEERSKYFDVYGRSPRPFLKDARDMVDDGQLGRLAQYYARGTAKAVQIHHIHVKDLAMIECKKHLPKSWKNATLQDGSELEPEVKSVI